MSDTDLNTHLYRRYSYSQEDWANQQVENLEVYNGAQWTEDQIRVLEERGQMPSVIQAMWQITEQAVSMLSANRPTFQGSARADGDQYTASVWSDLFQWMWQLSRGQQRIQTIFRDNYVQSRGVAYPYIDWNADFGKGEVMFKDMDPKMVYPDPNAKDPLWDDAEHIIVRRIFSLAQIERMWGTEVAREVRERGQMDDGERFTTQRTAYESQAIIDEQINREDNIDLFEVIERYTKVMRRHWRVMDPQTAEENVFNEEQYLQERTRETFLQFSQGTVQVITKEPEVQQLNQFYDQMGLAAHGGYFHLQAQAPVIDDSGQVIEQPPTPVPGKAGPDAIPGSEQRLVPSTMGEMIDQGIVPVTEFLLSRIRVVGSSGDVLVYDPVILPTSHYPTVCFPGSHNRNPYTIGEVQRMRPLQDIINKTMSLILAHASTSTNQKVFVPRQTAIEDLEAKWGRAGASILEYDQQFGGQNSSGTGIEIVNPPQLPAALYANLDRSISLMERIAGIFSIQQGDATAAPQTYNATLAIDEFGMRRIKGKLDIMYTSLERLGRIMMDYAQHVYTEEKVLRLVKPNGERRTVQINSVDIDATTKEAQEINNITRGHYDVSIIAGSTLPNNRWAMLQQYIELFERGLIDDVAVIRQTELPDGEEILERNSMYRQMQSQMQQMQDAISKLEGDLQTADREVRHARQRVELEKFKTQLNAMENNMAAAEEVFDANLKAELDKSRTILQQQRQAKTSDSA